MAHSDAWGNPLGEEGLGALGFRGVAGERGSVRCSVTWRRRGTEREYWSCTVLFPAVLLLWFEGSLLLLCGLPRATCGYGINCFYLVLAWRCAGSEKKIRIRVEEDEGRGEAACGGALCEGVGGGDHVMVTCPGQYPLFVTILYDVLMCRVRTKMYVCLCVGCESCADARQPYLCTILC